MSSGYLSRPLRFAVATAAVMGLAASSVPAVAASDPSAAVRSAQATVRQAQAAAATQDSALAQARGNLAGAERQLLAVQGKVAALNAAMAGDLVTLDRIQAEMSADRVTLRAFLRISYEQGSEANLVYVLSSNDLQTALQRQASVQRVAEAGGDLVTRIRTEASDAQRVLDAAASARTQLATGLAQAATEAVLVRNEEQQVGTADAASHQSVASAQGNLSQAVKQQQAVAAAQAAAARAAAAQAAAARAAAAQAIANQVRSGIQFAPVNAGGFTVDTDLTRPSGESATRLNAFLQGSPLQGLGQSFMAAEKTHRVSARYLLAHAIEESAFGTSQIAQDKHNLFGYGADDAHPYTDAVTFPSFAACIDTVSAKVAANYLDPAGSYFHGPTLRGMNVDYASDPNWADQIAAIATSFP